MSEKDDNHDWANEQLLIQEGLHKVKSLQNKLRPIGICHQCSEAVGTGQVFCDEFCSEDYEKRQRAEKQRVY